MIESFSRLKTELLMKGYIYLWCFRCDKTTLHKPTITIKKGWTLTHKIHKYKCTQCGELTQKPKKVRKKKSKETAWMQNRSKKGRFGKKLRN